MFELRDDDPILQSKTSAALTVGNVGRLSAAVGSFQKRADAILDALDDLNKRLDMVEKSFRKPAAVSPATDDRASVLRKAAAMPENDWHALLAFIEGRGRP